MDTEEINKWLQENLPDILPLKIRLDESKINPITLFYVLNAIEAICMDTKYGNVEIVIQDNQILTIKGTHQNLIKQPAIL